MEYGSQTGNPQPQASANRMNVAADNIRMQSTTMIDPSTFISIEAVTENSPTHTKSNAVAASNQLFLMGISLPFPLNPEQGYELLLTLQGVLLIYRHKRLSCTDRRNSKVD